MTTQDEPAWDRFVFENAEGTFFHRAGWKTIFKDVFGLEPHYLLAERNGSLVGVLPLVYQRSLLFGNALMSSPFCVEGGPLASDQAADEALTSAALALQTKTKSPSLEFRTTRARHTGWVAKGELYATFAGPITADDKANLLAIPRKQRAVVRKTLESALASTVDEDVDRLFAVYAESVRNLGNTSVSQALFRRVKAGLWFRLRHCRGDGWRARSECGAELLPQGDGAALLRRWHDRRAALWRQRFSLLGGYSQGRGARLSPL